MGNETRRILDLLAQGKVTADEAEQLLAATNQPPQDAAAPAESAEPSAAPKQLPKWLRVVVFRQPSVFGSTINGATAKKEVSVRIPLSLVRAGVKLGAIMPGAGGEQVNRHLREHGIDLSKIDPAHIEEVMKELGEMTIDVDDGKHQVRVFCE
jgi:hypothetical protein